MGIIEWLIGRRELGSPAQAKEQQPNLSDDLPALVALYHEAATQLLDSQRELWASLSYALVANSVLVLAWVEAYGASATDHPAYIRAGVLLAVSAIGLVLSTIWLIVTSRLMGYFPAFWRSVLGFEDAVSKHAAKVNPERTPGVYRATSTHYEKLQDRRIKGPRTHTLIRSAHVAFMLLYVALAVASASILLSAS